MTKNPFHRIISSCSKTIIQTILLISIFNSLVIIPTSWETKTINNALDLSPKAIIPVEMELNHMVYNNKNNIITKTTAVVALVTLMFLALSFMIVPNEGADSAFVLKLKADERRNQIVEKIPGSSTTFDMELYSTNVDTFDHKIGFQVTDITYRGGSSAAHWEFAFVGYDESDAGYYVYYAGENDVVDVPLMVTYQGSTGGEMVTFTITGIEDGQNDTRLSPQGGQSAQFDFLSVISSTPNRPYLEPTSGDDRGPLDLPDQGSFSVTMWNLGSEDDKVYISDWGVWQDDGDGDFSPAAGRAGEDVRNDNFDITFKLPTGADYVLDQEIDLNSGDSQEIIGTITPERDNSLVPAGDYFIQLEISSLDGDPDTMVLQASMEELALPDLTVLKLEPDKYDLEKGESVTIKATVNIESEVAGSFTYKFMVDDEDISGATGTIDYTADDNSKIITYTWKAKTGATDTRILKVVVDPADDITESNENNNQRTAPITVTEEDAKFPYWILALVIIALVVAVGAYAIYAAGPNGNITIEEIIIRPDQPKAGSPAVIVALLKNEGNTIEMGNPMNIMVSFYEDYESIGEKPVDLTTDGFEGGSTREVSLTWEPAAAGQHNLNVAVDIDDDESDVSSKDIEIGE